MTDKEKYKLIRVEIIPRLNRFVNILYDCPYTSFERARLLDNLVNEITQILDSNEPA